MEKTPKPHSLWLVCIILILAFVIHGLWKNDKFAYGEIATKVEGFVSNTANNTLADSIFGTNNISGDTIIKVKEKIEKSNSSPTRPKDTIRIGFVGDIIPGLNASTDIFLDINSYTQEPDLMIGNFEGAIQNDTHSKCREDDRRCFSFGGNTDFLSLLKNASFDVLNVANNHFNDYGEIGQIETLEEIKNTEMISSGVKNHITYIKKQDVKIGIVGFSNYKWTTDMNNKNIVESQVREAKLYSDIVIVIFHGGGEGVDYTHVPNEIEWYLGENRGDLRSFGRQAIDAGADLVLGSGPHVLRGMEWYNDKLIAYSLGNFSSSNKLSIVGALKTSALLDVTLNKQGQFLGGKVVPLEINNSGAPQLDPKNTAIQTINELSQSDFGGQGIVLNFQGEIQIK